MTSSVVRLTVAFNLLWSYHCVYSSFPNPSFINWPVGFRLAPGAARFQATVVSRSVQVDSRGAALTVSGWLRVEWRRKVTPLFQQESSIH